MISTMDTSDKELSGKFNMIYNFYEIYFVPDNFSYGKNPYTNSLVRDQRSAV